jgi:hypothetical protein
MVYLLSEVIRKLQLQPDQGPAYLPVEEDLQPHKEL